MLLELVANIFAVPPLKLTMLVKPLVVNVEQTVSPLVVALSKDVAALPAGHVYPFTLKLVSICDVVVPFIRLIPLAVVIDFMFAVPTPTPPSQRIDSSSYEIAIDYVPLKNSLTTVYVQVLL